MNFGDRFGCDSGFFDGVTDGWGGLGWVVDFDKILFKPKTDFFETTLRFVGHLEEINFGLVVMVEIIGDDVLKFGIGASANIASNIVTIFVHDKENVGTVEVFPEAFVSAEEALGISAVVWGEGLAGIETRDGPVLDVIIVGAIGVVIKNRGRPVDYFVTATLEIASPIDGTFIKFGTTANNEFFHNCK